MADTSDSQEKVNITFDNSQIKAGRDVTVTGIKKETLIENVDKGAVVTVGDHNNLSQPQADTPDLATSLANWQAVMESKIEALTELLMADKEDLKNTVAKIKDEASKAEQADSGRLERLINSVAVMGPDIFEVIVTTLASPLSGIGLVLKKIGDKAKIERQAQQA